MTVSSLWKLLDEAGCGKLVGSKEIANPNLLNDPDAEKVNPWNFNAPDRKNRSRRRQVLAIDLSIWICESLTSNAMSECHENPSLYLVYTRTMKLLNLGIKPVFVVEGKRRTLRDGRNQTQNVRKRRSGTVFWNSCRDCRKMLELLGVPVVQARCEGEALCALLNQKGIVDGVISNDGDCLLFGAQVIYTKFSIENLDAGSVVRYEVQNLKGKVEPGFDGELDAQAGIVSLSRQDLIAFALLTGSDLAGNGFHKVGHKKAIRFIRKCHYDNPLSVETAAIDEMKSWSRASMAVNAVSPDIQSQEQKHQCTRCCHSGTKRDHQKSGCKLCGTEPGEPCFKMTRDDQFRKYLRDKALAMHPKFDPSMVVNSYMSPNDNLIPLQLAGKTASNIPDPNIDFAELMQFPFAIKGTDLKTSRMFIQDTAAKFMARASLMKDEGPPDKERQAETTVSKGIPVPETIVKQVVKNHMACYEVRWHVAATLCDETGEGINGYQFTTVEDEVVIKMRYPSLVKEFEETTEQERVQQGDKEKNRRKRFLDHVVFQCGAAGAEDENERANKRRLLLSKRRQGVFLNGLNKYERKSFDAERQSLELSGGDDVCNLLRFISNNKKNKNNKNNSHKGGQCYVQERCTVIESATSHWCPQRYSKDHNVQLARDDDSLQIMTDCDFFCHMGDLAVPVTPIKSHQGTFPPKHIYVIRE